MTVGKNFGPKKPRYTLRNPHKYMGDADNVIYRSSWEYNAFKFCDNNKFVITWSSEEIVIPYMKPYFKSNGQLDFKEAKYYTDLYVEYVNKHGDLQKELIEIKPKKQTVASKAKNYAKNFVENMTYIVNQAKWDAANNWCQINGVKFFVMTEDTLFKLGDK